MAATAGTAVFRTPNGKTLVKDLYLDDVAGAKVNWDDGGGASATTKEEWTLPMGCDLVDLAIVTGAAQTRLQITRNQNPTGDILRHVVQVDTSAGRKPLAIPFSAGNVIAILQLA